MQDTNFIPSVPALEVVNGHPTTLSTHVAEYFGKRHDNVIRDIRNLIESAPSLGHLNFEESYYKSEQGKKQPCYRMDRKGFVLLAMGFTGEKALQFKIAYIDAFDRMEEELRNSTADKLKAVIPLTPRQQYKIQRAVAERAKGSHVHFNTIYKAIKIYFKVAKYDQIPVRVLTSASISSRQWIFEFRKCCQINLLNSPSLNCHPARIVSLLPEGICSRPAPKRSNS